VRITHSKVWPRIVILGVVYFVVGYGSSLLDHSFSAQIHFWRIAAWVVAAAIYIGHLTYEQFSLANPPLTTSTHVGIAAAIGGFLLAVAATAHAAIVLEHASYARHLIAWIAWPLLTGVPAFLVSFVLTLGLRWLKIPRAAA
jgi:hypothetical protein